MKRLWISVLVLLLLFSAALLSNRTLCRMTSEITDLLEQAEAQYQAGDSAQALALTKAAREKWDAANGFFYTMLHHSEGDAILVLFTQAQQYLEQGESGGEYPACNAALITQIDLLCEAEALSWKNVL